MKAEFFDLYPDYNYAKEGFPEVHIQIVQEKRAAQRNKPTGKQLEREVTIEVERRKLKCGCNAHTKDSKNSCKKRTPKISQLPMSKRQRPILKVGESSKMRKSVAVVRPFGAQNQRNEENLHPLSPTSPS